MRKISLLCLLVLFVSALAVAQTSAPVLLRQPAIGQNLIAFEYGNEIWTAPRAGGDARPITTGPGIKSTPFISPDGKLIAYTGFYDGNADVYVIPSSGGEAQRLTHHPGADVVMGWMPDSKAVLFRSARNSFNGFNRLFTVSLEGGLPHEVPLPTAEAGWMSPDGSHIAYVPVTNWYQGIAWKRYHGGRQSRVWIADLKDSSTVEIPRTDSNDLCPMWIGNKVYFLSDRKGAVTLFSYDTGSKQVEQLLPATGPDIISATAGPGAIILERVGKLQVYDLGSKKVSDLNVRVAGDLPGLRPHFAKVTDQIRGYALSPNGVRAVFEAHGEVLTVPAEKGDIRNLTNTPGVAERDPAWSPDGKQIAFFSDEGGEYSLHIRNQDAMGETKKIKLSDTPSFFYDPQWSPDSKRILYTDKHLNLWYVDVASAKPVLIDTDYYPNRTMEPTWSPDNKWIAYAKCLPSQMRALYVYSLDSGKSTQATDGLSDAGNPQFDKSGKYLFFTASTDVGPSQSGIDLSILSHTPTRSAYVAVLRKDLPSPLAPESDEEAAAPEAKPDTPPGAPPATAQTPAAAPAANGDKPQEGAGPKAGARPAAKVEVKIDFDGMSQRILALPIPARNYQNLIAGEAGSIFLLEAPDPRSGGGDGPGGGGGIAHRFDLKSRKFQPLLTGITAFTLSENGKKMLYRMGPPRAARWLIANVPPVPPSGAPPTPEAAAPPRVNGEALKLDAMQVMVDPRAEWQQMYREAWRIERDFFYDPNLHGVDWKKYEAAYKPYIDGLSSREDLDYIFTDMLGELTVGHMFIRGPQPPPSDQPAAGLLGADYTVEGGRYKIAKVYEGENWNPGLRAPLTEPGVNVKQGEYLLEVNGRELKGDDEIFALFQGTAGKQTVIKVASDAAGKNARTVTVVPIANESNLRNRAWIDDNRKRVDQLSGGKLAYVYLPDTAQGGYTYFNRYFFAQLDRAGAVIDERWNRGGLAADYVVDYLRRPIMNYFTPRDGHDFTTPGSVLPGPKVMITNMYAGSGGDALPWYFRFHKIGPLVGTRTWGGLIGIGGYPELMDGGTVTAPHFAFFNTKGEWDVENHGVAPDYEVEMSPKAWREGHDLQLEKAVELVMTQLKTGGYVPTKKPAFPNYHKADAGGDSSAARGK